MHQLGLLTNGEFPRRVITAGFSLGGGLSELCGMWAAILWPTADILVANQVRAGGGGAGLRSAGAWGARVGCLAASRLLPRVHTGAPPQGGPIPGNEDFKLLFEATVGRAYKYSYRMDIVNNAAPLAWWGGGPGEGARVLQQR